MWIFLNGELPNKVSNCFFHWNFVRSRVYITGNGSKLLWLFVSVMFCPFIYLFFFSFQGAGLAACALSEQHTGFSCKRHWEEANWWQTEGRGEEIEGPAFGLQPHQWFKGEEHGPAYVCTRGDKQPRWWTCNKTQVRYTCTAYMQKLWHVCSHAHKDRLYTGLIM